MCGRFTQAYTWRELVALYGLTQPALILQPRYNIAPTTTIDVLIPRSADQLELWPMRWGLIPSWWTKSLKELPSTFNARAETVTGRPMFRDAFRERREFGVAATVFERQNRDPESFLDPPRSGVRGRFDGGRFTVEQSSFAQSLNQVSSELRLHDFLEFPLR